MDSLPGSAARRPSNSTSDKDAGPGALQGAEELQQGLVLGRIVLPQIARLALARKDPTNKHHLDHIDKLDILVYHVLNARLRCCQLVWQTLV